MMARPSTPRRRALKTGIAKGEYYPKVDLSDLDGRLPSSWSPSSVVTPAEEPADEESVAAAEPAREEEEFMPPPVVYLETPAPSRAPAAEPAPAPVAAASPVAAGDVLRLPISLDLPAARPLAAALLERRGKPITIDASAVGQVGAQCVQVLLSAKRTWEADGVSLSIVNCAARMVEDLMLIGIDRTLVTGELPQ
jgi:anti-anti-sigma regulatory factor